MVASARLNSFCPPGGGVGHPETGLSEVCGQSSRQLQWGEHEEAVNSHRFNRRTACGLFGEKDKHKTHLSNNNKNKKKTATKTIAAGAK